MAMYGYSERKKKLLNEMYKKKKHFGDKIEFIKFL